MKSKLGICVIGVLIAISVAGCSDRKNLSPFPTIAEKTRADLKRPVNCGTAKQDIATLEEERASVGKRVISGVRMVLPVAVVAGILMGDYGDRVEVTTGQYNADIDAKVEQIRASCGV